MNETFVGGYCPHLLPCGVCRLTQIQCYKWIFSKYDVICMDQPSSVNISPNKSEEQDHKAWWEINATWEGNSNDNSSK